MGFGAFRPRFGVFLLAARELDPKPARGHGRGGTRRVAAGDIEQTLGVPSADEVGDLARALGQMIDYIREKAAAAEALGRGDLQVTIAPRSDKDTLGKSFQDMKQSLARLVEDSSVLIQARACR